MDDAFVPAYTTLIVATKTRGRYWDGDAVRQPPSANTHARLAKGVDSRPTSGKKAENPNNNHGSMLEIETSGAPLLDWWNAPADEVVRRLTLAMCPRRVCRECGKPSTRIVESEREYWREAKLPNAGRNHDRNDGGAGPFNHTETRTTLGWSDCGHNDWRPGVVVDPFQRQETDVSHARYIVGDVFDVLATLEPGSVDLVMTSPPFLALRSYLPADHPDKAREIGSEATPGEFIDTMLDVVEACARVLAPHGSLVFELGDTYSMSGGAGGDYAEGGLRDGQPTFKAERKRASGNAWGSRAVGARRDGTWGTDEHESQRFNPGDGEAPLNGGPGWPMPKSKVLIPQLFAVALAYGFNPLTGRQTEPWRVRNVVCWARPNPPVGRDGDKFRPATSFLTVACKARDRYWDGDAVRTAHQRDPERRADANGYERYDTGARCDDGAVMAHQGNPAGAPLLDWWEIPTEPYAGSHYATFPRNLVVPVVKACCPQRVCRVCGKPSTRIVQAANGYADKLGSSWADRDEGRTKSAATERNHGSGQPVGDHITAAQYETIGWSDCGHGDFRVGRVLDPFAGSGTTLAVATGHGLDAIGIDLDERNATLAEERIGGLFLTVEHHKREVVA